MSSNVKAPFASLVFRATSLSLLSNKIIAAEPPTESSVKVPVRETRSDEPMTS